MADFLEEKKREIGERLKELEPLVDEHRRLEAALRALEGVQSGGSSSSASTSSRTRARTNGGGGGAGRPKGSGPRAAEALSLVQGSPGITISEMAQKMGIQQNYLYRVLPGLEQDGKVRKEGMGWFPAEG